MIILYSGYAVSVVLSYPLIIWEAREGVHELCMQSLRCLKKRGGAGQTGTPREQLLPETAAGDDAVVPAAEDEVHGSSDCPKFCTPVVQRVCLNVCIISLTAALGIFGSNVGCVIGYVGSTCSPMMVYVLPVRFCFHNFFMIGYD
jgi:hypothetical protein